MSYVPPAAFAAFVHVVTQASVQLDISQAGGGGPVPLPQIVGPPHCTASAVSGTTIPPTNRTPTKKSATIPLDALEIFVAEPICRMICWKVFID